MIDYEVSFYQNSELRTQNSELRTQNSELRTQNSELRTQNSELRTQNSELVKSASNNQIKLLRKLGQKKYREKEGLFVVEGERAVEQVLENGILRVREVFLEEGKAVSYQLTANSFYELDSKVMAEVTDTENSQGILAVCEIPTEASVEELSKREGLIVATDRIQDPGNLGTILRTAAWFGVSAVLAGKGSVDLHHPKVVRSTAGATGVLPYRNSDLKQDLEVMEREGWEILLLDGNEGAVSISTINSRNKTILVVGNEANGVDKNLVATNRKCVMIPSSEENRSVESLNAAIALSIALYQLNG
ncbi:MAG: TrmH family RNA methyltransferase [Balneola sp.]